MEEQKRVNAKAAPIANPTSMLRKIDAFAKSWYGTGTGLIVVMAPVLLGWWAQKAESESICIVSDDATTDMLIACSTTGKFNASSAQCLKVMTEDGTDVESQFNLSITIYMLGFIGFAITIASTKIVEDIS
jgi:hypothetical protein